MYKSVTASLERLSEAAFRVRLYGGGMAHAFVEPDGSLRIPELEEVC